MTTVYKIILLIFIICLAGCHSTEKNQTKIIVSGQVGDFEKIIEKNSNTNSELTIDAALNSIVEIYQTNEKIETKSNEKPIALYVIYGTDYWDENLKTFQIIFAHQQVNKDDGKLYEYRIDMIYEAKNLNDVGNLDLRFDKSMNLETYKKTILKSIGIQKAIKIKPNKIEIVKEQI